MNEPEDPEITVCKECRQASCWQGIFMCQASKDADIIKMRRSELEKLRLEHPSYWKSEAELCMSQ